MDATHPSARLSMANRTPMRIGAYGLLVRDLASVTDFYRRTVGFDVVEKQQDRAVLGVAGTPLLHLEQRADLQPDDPSMAGLFHTAFVLPTRKNLAQWLLHARRIGLTIARTGDHLVNEAIYYDDPEGNGCECYADRPPETWQWDAEGHVDIDTGRLVDLEQLAQDTDASGSEWTAPSGLRIGHINIRVGDYAEAERFYSGVLGLDHTGRRHIDFKGRPNTITFMSSGRYHHHLAANDFTSRGAGARDPDRAGLSWFAIEHAGAAELEATRRQLRAAGVALTPRDDGFEVVDPWGTRVRLTVAAE